LFTARIKAKQNKQVWQKKIKCNFWEQETLLIFW